MYTPHTVSLISYHSGNPYLTILRGVMLQGPMSRPLHQKGDVIEDNLTLYIPLSVRAENADGEEKTFLPPLAYAACEDPEKHWSLQPEGETAGRCGFFVKGTLSEAPSLEEARDRYDDVFVISGYTVHDYGSRPMRHYEVKSKVSSRYYQYQ